MTHRFGPASRLTVTACAVALVGTALPFAGPPPARADATGTSYYVDSQAGSDANSGTSSSAPWRSLTKVDATTFQPGDRILLADGSEWSGTTLWPKGSGDAADHITVGDYGSGSLPRIDGAGVVANRDLRGAAEIIRSRVQEPADESGFPCRHPRQI